MKKVIFCLCILVSIGLQAAYTQMPSEEFLDYFIFFSKFIDKNVDELKGVTKSSRYEYSLKTDEKAEIIFWVENKIKDVRLHSKSSFEEAKYLELYLLRGLYDLLGEPIIDINYIWFSFFNKYDLNFLLKPLYKGADNYYHVILIMTKDFDHLTD